jgi:hypothetical protein
MSQEQIIDAPVAYEPSLNIDMPPQRFKSVEKLPAREDLSIDQQLSLQLEEVETGLSYDDDKQAFLDSHNAALDVFQTFTHDIYNEVKEPFTSSLVRYLDKNIQNGTDWAQVIPQRLDGIKNVFATDYLKTPGLAMFTTFSNNINISNMWSLTDKFITDEYLKSIVLPHELLHAASVKGVVIDGLQTEFFTANIHNRTGMRLLTPEVYPVDTANQARQAEWLDEAVLENLRGKISPSTEGLHGYRTTVPLVRALFQVRSELESKLEEALFSPVPLGPIYGEVEKLLGPFAIEKISELNAYILSQDMDEEDALQTMSSFVTSLVTPEYRETLPEAFREQYAAANPMDLEQQLAKQISRLRAA